MTVQWKVCLAVAALIVAGSAQAATPDAAAERNVASRSAAAEPPAGAGDPAAHGNTAGLAPESILAGLSNPPDPASLRHSVMAANGPLSDAALRPHPVGEKAPALILAQLSSVSPPSTFGSRDRTAFLFSADELPEPAGWMTLMCGLLVGAFMVRRKRGHYAD